ncbi:MAG: SDR family oxidoreductase, partial [Polyangiaceae bacterium]|nr:SDR family oxidoreductase [Polyangiaceae bacterium]
MVTVAPGDTFAKTGDGQYVLSPERGREGYDALVRDLIATGKVPQRIVHLWLLTADESYRPGSSFFHRNLERGFYSLFFLAQSLGDENAARPLHVTVVANGMQRVGDEKLPYPEKATVLGPAQVVPKELPGLTCRVVDVLLPESRPQLFGGRVRMALADPFAGKRAVDEALVRLCDSLIEEAVAEPGNDVVAYRNGRRWVRAYRPMPLPSADAGAAQLREEGVYLITGGFGDLALVLAEDLARRSRARLVLVSRIELPPRARFSERARQGGESDRVARAIRAIERLEALGAQVLPVHADVSNLEQMRAAVASARERFGTIHGVLHAAGVVKDELVQLKSLPDIEEVFTP